MRRTEPRGISCCAGHGWISSLALNLGLASMLLLTQFVQAQTYTVLRSLAWGDGANPNAGVVADKVGNLYGTAQYGGLTGNGTVFKIDVVGEFSVLHDFDGSDGSRPLAAVRIDPAGNLCSTAWIDGPLGEGLVFRLDPNGREDAVYSFNGPAGGAHPSTSVISDAEGNTYGATWDGGNYITCHSCGVVYKLSPAGKETVLHTFNGGIDGANMVAGVIRDAKGVLYGTTYQGGSGACDYQAGGCGILFAVNPSGKETILHTFTGPDGAAPMGGLAQDRAGNFYGSTTIGGDANLGVLFELDTSGNFSVLHSFTGPDGANPSGDLVWDQGYLYGTAITGGTYNLGEVYKFDLSSNTVEVLHSFSGGADGENPDQVKPLLYKGSIYGTTYYGGQGYGVIFKLTPR